MDARTILPRAIETHYYARFNLKDLIMFFHQRFDQNIQPVIDNAMAYKMLIEVAEIFPEVLTVVNPHATSRHYVSTARTGKATNLYFPCKENDVFEYNEKDFIYSCERDELNGTDPVLGKRENFKFTKFQDECDIQIERLKSQYESWKKDVGFVE
jgi:thymidylate synthase ThyX